MVLFRAIRRFFVGVISMFAVMILALIIDTAGAALIEVSYEYGVDEGPFAPVLTLVDNLVWIIVPFMLLGLSIWWLWSPVREERRGEQLRRVGPP